MDRLTEYAYDTAQLKKLKTEHAYKSCHDVCDECSEDCEQDSRAECPINEAFNRLAAYEDTGLTPEKITTLTAESTVSKMETITLKEELRDAYENHCDDFIRLNSEIAMLKKALELAMKLMQNYKVPPMTKISRTVDDFIQQAQEQEGKDNAK